LNVALGAFGEKASVCVAGIGMFASSFT
jgi:hypothetical protein